MAAKVYFVSARVKRKKTGLIQHFGELIGALGLSCVAKGDTVAVKVHFGDDGTTAFVRPQFARKLIDRIKAAGGHPFLTDTCTLYPGRRRHAVTHLELALENGFAYATVAAPLIIGDGIRSQEVATVPLEGKHFSSVRYASAVHNADALICISRVKGHLAAGFGGTIKNISMGVGSRAMKQAMHADVTPKLDETACTACGDCVEICAENAVTLAEGVARFDLDACVGCAECIAVCPSGALEILWNEKPDLLQEKMVEVAAGALAAKAGKVAFFNFLVEVTPDCDCFAWSDNPIVNNIGILASTDPVAIDQASVDLINAAPGLPGSRLREKGLAPGGDKLRDLYPKVNWERQLAYGEAFGLGSRKYDLVEV